MHWRSYSGPAILLGARFHSVYAVNTGNAVRGERASNAPPDLDGHGIIQSPGLTSMDTSVTASGFIASTINDDFSSASSEPSTITVYRNPSAVTTSGDSPSPSNQSTPVGAICGGVIGGLFVLGLIILSIFCLFRCRNSKSNNKRGSSSSNLPAMIQQPYLVHQDPYLYQPPQQDIVSPHSNPNMASPWTQQPSISTHATAPIYEVARHQARELEPIHEIDTDSPTKQ